MAKSLGIPDATLHTWVHKAKGYDHHATIIQAGEATEVNVAKLLEEIKLLKKRLARSEQEKAILKKAATYFARESE